MLDFVFFGVELNVYALITLWLIVKAIYPKGYVSKYDKKFSLLLKITLTLIPYFVFIICAITLIVFLYLEFDYKKIEAKRDELAKRRANE